MGSSVPQPASPSFALLDNVCAVLTHRNEMPHRVNAVEDSVTVKLDTAEVTLPFDARQDLLVQLGENDIAIEIRSAFAAAGATEPVELTPEQKTYLLAVIERRTDEDLPEGVPALRDALRVDVG